MRFIRFVYALIAILIWTILIFPIVIEDMSVDALCLSYAIVFAGALAGGDGK